MKTLTLYSSKYGTTEACAKKIQSELNGDIRSLDDVKNISLQAYDQIIIGSSVYIGQLRKPVTQFIKSHEDVLKNKPISFFFCCNETTDYKDLIPEAIKHADVYYFGFELKMSEMKFMDKFITKKMTKTTEDVSKLKTDEINKLIQDIKK